MENHACKISYNKQLVMLAIFAVLTILNAGIFIQYFLEEKAHQEDTEIQHFVPRGWLDYPQVIAHAGGALREKNKNTTYTNSLDAFKQNYNLGHRVFEFDFYPTDDNNLAVVHDWDNFGNRNGVALSSDEWKHFETGYTTMVLDDILSLMTKYPDFYIVTDTKLKDETSRGEFETLYRKAKEVDIKLLDRFVPQIYNNEMYDYIADIYPWKSMIYTVYQTSYSPREVVDFAISKPEIEVITFPSYDTRYDADVIEYAHKNGLLLFSHTVNAYTDITGLHAIGTDGFYTDFLLPRDVELLYEYND